MQSWFYRRQVAPNGENQVVFGTKWRKPSGIWRKLVVNQVLFSADYPPL